MGLEILPECELLGETEAVGAVQRERFHEVHKKPLAALLETRQESGIRADLAKRLRDDGEVDSDLPLAVA